MYINLATLQSIYWGGSLKWLNVFVKVIPPVVFLWLVKFIHLLVIQRKFSISAFPVSIFFEYFMPFHLAQSYIYCLSNEAGNCFENTIFISLSFGKFKLYFFGVTRFVIQIKSMPNAKCSTQLQKVNKPRWHKIFKRSNETKHTTSWIFDAKLMRSVCVYALQRNRKQCMHIVYRYITHIPARLCETRFIMYAMLFYCF